MTSVRLDALDAVELVEIFEFLIDWLDQLTNHELNHLPLADPAHQITDIRAVLDRSRNQLLHTKTCP